MMIFSKILLLAGIALLFLFFYSLARGKNSLAELFSVNCLLSSIYVLGYVLELNADSLEQISFYLKLEYFGVSFIPFFWFLFSYRFYYNKYPSFKVTLLTAIIPFLTLFFSATNEFHHWHYLSISAVELNGHLIAHLSKGPWYYVATLYNYTMLILGMIMFGKIWRNTGFDIKTPSFWMLFGSISMVLLLAVYNIGLVPIELDLAAFGIAVFTFCLAIALYHSNFIELKGIIRGIVFSQINEGIFVIDDKHRLVDFNYSGQKIFDWLKATNLGKNISCFEEAQAIIKTEADAYENEIIIEGKKRHFQFRVTPIKENNLISGYVYIFQDITKEKEMLEKLNNMAYYDSLTQLYNRRKFLSEAELELSRAIQYNKPTSVLMIDIDNFKKTNDKYGHLAGDEVLIGIANQLKKRLRAKDIIGRFGGEEFAVVLAETNRENAFLVAESIRQTIEAFEISYKGQVIKSTVSIGISTDAPEDKDIKIESLIDLADQALYGAKSAGKNTVFPPATRPHKS